MADQSFWPDEFGETQIVAPVTLLRQQAAQLGQKTRGMVEAQVGSMTEGHPLYDAISKATGRPFFRHSFKIVAPSLDGYTYELFTIRHGIDLYPVQIVPGSFSGARPELQTEEDLLEWLKGVLGSDRTKRIVGSLLAQIRQSPGPLRTLRV